MQKVHVFGLGDVMCTGGVQGPWLWSRGSSCAGAWQDGEVWRSLGTSCEECRCFDGSVSCGSVQCRDSPTYCPPGQTLKRTTQQCCPICVASGRSCQVPGGSTVSDGTIWQPLACTKCHCRDGDVRCYLAECPRLVCPANHTLELNPATEDSSCCPECLGHPCLHVGRVYKSGEQWQPDPCNLCACQAGRVECHVTRCPALSCPSGQEPMKKEGTCCPTCMPKEGWCILPNGDRKSPGAVWPGLSCPEVCQCLSGTVSCSNAVCPTLVCGHGQKLVERPEGRCCPDCQRDTGLCFTDGHVKKSGEVWSSGCKLCSCEEGSITCYTPECPACSPGYTPFYRSPNTSLVQTLGATIPEDDTFCCPVCERVSCSSNCIACEDSLSHLPSSQHGYPLAVLPAGSSARTSQRSQTAPACTACASGYKLQDGACVKNCGSDRFHRDGHCIKCHSSCLTCSEETKFQCTKCPPGRYLFEGQCEVSCPQTHHASEATRVCRPCHASCGSCHGSWPHSCDSCARGLVLLKSTCVAQCPDGHVVRAGKCTSCSSSCLTCGLQEECLACTPPLLLQEGRCVQQCHAGYYTSEDIACLKCHSHCATCTGPGIASCTSCPAHLHLHETSCLASCPVGHYGQEGTCLSCHDSCFECTGPAAHQCTSCFSSRILVMEGLSNSGSCLTSCPPSFMTQDNICYGSTSCLKPASTSSHLCVECSEGWLLEAGQCLRKCSPGFYKFGNSCLACDGRCTTCSDGGPDACTSCPALATLFRRPSDPTVASCLTKCRERYYLSPDLACLPCHTSCSACIASRASRLPKSSPSSTCLVCKESGWLPEADRCVQSCSPSFYEVLPASLPSDVSDGTISKWANGSCSRCHPTCTQCDGPGPFHCTACSEGLRLTDKHSCSEEPCDVGYFKSSSGTCEQCSSSCLGCSGDSSTCTSCKRGSFLLQGQCVSKCGPKYFLNNTAAAGLEARDDFTGTESVCEECHYSCKGCLGPSARDCLECDEGSLREDNTCVGSCSPGFYASQLSRQCVRCPSGCRQCSMGDSDAHVVCHNCLPPYLLSEGVCVTDCPDGTTLNLWDLSCSRCSQNCLMCSAYKCLECQPEFYLQNGLCVSNCSENYHVIERNVSTCVSNVYQPILNVLSPLVVEYGGVRVFNSSVIHIFDRDTSEEDLLITVMAAPSNGYLYQVSDGKNQLLRNESQFTAKELREGRIVFQHERGSSFYGELTLDLYDGKFTTNPSVVSINVVSSHKPHVVVNEPLIVRRGGKAAVTKDVLRLIDQDSAEAVNILVRDGPEYGRLTIDDEDLALFSLEELLSNAVTYINSEPMPTTAPVASDQVLLQASDGHNVVNFRLRILFVDQNRPAPIMVANKGITIEKGQRKQITPDVLRARDVDSRDETLIYSVMSASAVDHPTGEFVLVIPLPPVAAGFYNDGWIQMDESHLLRPTLSFSQRDLNEGRVWYVTSDAKAQSVEHTKGYQYSDNSNHRGPLYGLGTGFEGPEMDDAAYSEVILFSVSDSAEPPNVLKDQTFVVHIEEPIVPIVPNDTKKENRLQFEVLEGQALTFTSAELNLFPSSSVSKHQIVYTITRPLGPDEGVLFHIDSPGLELREFTQFDVDNLKIIYLPPFASIGPAEKVYSFKFKGSDGTEEHGADGLTEHKLNIRVIPKVSEEISFAEPNPSLVVAAHGSVDLDPSIFQLADGSEDDLVLFVLQEAPQHGRLVITPFTSGGSLADVPFTKDVSLTMLDVRNARIQYQHSGSSSTSDSAVLLALGQASEAVTKISFVVELEDNLRPEPAPSAAFAIKVEEGSSTMVSPSVVFYNDLHSSHRELVYTLAAVPVHGSLMLAHAGQPPRALNATHKFTQQDIMEGKLIFSADVDVGPSQVLDVVIFNVTDPSNNVLKDQRLNITILPVDNQSPELTLSSIGELSAPEGGVVALPANILGVTDADTPPSRLRVMLVVPPVYGFITYDKLGGPESGVSQFPVSALQEGLLYYRQSQHLYQEPRRDAIIFFVTDGLRNTQSFRMNISITPSDDERPLLELQSVTVDRGRTVVLRDTSITVSDDDTPQHSLSITVSRLPQHGVLYLNQDPSSGVKDSVALQPRQVITLDDVSIGRLLYEHDGSATDRDSIELKVSDGVQESGGELELLIVDETELESSEGVSPKVLVPRLLRKQTLSVTEGHSSIISGQQLLAVVDGLSSDAVEFVISEAPLRGALEKYFPDSQGWRPLRSGDEFLQTHLDDSLIRYKHNARSGVAPDEFLLDIHVVPEDDAVRVESLLQQKVKVQVLPDDALPQPVSFESLLVEENSRTAITRSSLEWQKEGSPQTNVVYKLVKGPSKGSLVLLGEANVEVGSWTQRDINSGRLMYLQNSSIEAREDFITFTVTDGKHETESQVLPILISPVDDQEPAVATRSSARVAQGASVVITHDHLEAVDLDTPDDKIIFRVMTPPVHGQLKIRNGIPDQWNPVTEFTMDDVRDGRLSYFHDDSYSSSDHFEVSVSDTRGRTDGPIPDFAVASVRVDVRRREIIAVPPPAPSEADTILVNRGLAYLERRSDGQVAEALGPSVLGTSLQEAHFTVTRPPRWGHLLLHDQQVSNFSQENLKLGKVLYVLNSSTKAPISRDSFAFTVSDSDEIIRKSGDFDIRWSWLKFNRSNVAVSRNQLSPIRVIVNRLGDLARESSVECAYFDGRRKSSSTAKFSTGQSSADCLINVEYLLNNENTSITVTLENPRRAIVSDAKGATLTISVETHRQSLVTFSSDELMVAETDDVISIGVKRTGHTDVTTTVLCITEDGTALGGNSVSMMGYDYVRRSQVNSSIIVFNPGESLSYCKVQVTDDRKYEPRESFMLILREPSKGSILGDHSSIAVTIDGPNDISQLKMKNSMLFFDSRNDNIDVLIQRSGVDLDYACNARCELTDPFGDAEETEITDTIMKPGSSTGACTFDSHHFKSEGTREYQIRLVTSDHCKVSSTDFVTKVMTMARRNSAVIQFDENLAVVNEPQGLVDIALVRSGNLSSIAEVNCFTRQRTAQAGEDYVDRPKVRNSTVAFLTGSSRAMCRLHIIDDDKYEQNEILLVKLAHPESDDTLRVSLGPHKLLRVRIEDPEDQPKISFLQDTFTAQAFQNNENTSLAFIELERKGDISKISRIRVVTKDDTAVAGLHYMALDDIVDFDVQQKRVKFMVEVKKYHASLRGELSKFFVVINSVDGVSAVVPTSVESENANTAVAVVQIPRVQEGKAAHLRLPAEPVVVSLRNYNNVAEYNPNVPVDGAYPLVCVSPCESHSPLYNSTKRLCNKIGLGRENKSVLNYFWKISVPNEDRESTLFQPILDSTIFAGANNKVLDSIFFSPNFLVKCVVTIMDDNGFKGASAHSKSAKIASAEVGICPRSALRNSAQKKPRASLSYVNDTDELHPNTIHIQLSVDHVAGMIPLVSTLPIHNVRYLLTEKLLRDHHACSNLHTGAAFMETSPDDVEETYVHQWDTSVRQDVAVSLYRHLDLKACQWRFEAWFTMKQLVDQCGGAITSDLQNESEQQSLLSVRVPIHVSYVTAAVLPPGWTSIDTTHELSLSFYYDTELWRQTFTGHPSLSAKMHVTHRALDESNRLVIEFTTVSKFRGQFVEFHPLLRDARSAVLPPSTRPSRLVLELLWSSATFNASTQKWRARTTTSLQDYTGEYAVELIPCTVSSEQSYSDLNTTSSSLQSDQPLLSSSVASAAALTDTPSDATHYTALDIVPTPALHSPLALGQPSGVLSVCRPFSPSIFRLPLAVKAPFRPVPLTYTLDTQFQLFRNEESFLQDPSSVDNPQASEFIGSYGPGEKLYGRVLWRPSLLQQEQPYSLTIFRVYVCSSTDGYVPTYDPTGTTYQDGRQYGCMHPHPQLHYRALILDRTQASLADSPEVNPLGLKAMLATETNRLSALHSIPGADGFALELDPLFGVGSGHSWFLQVLYSVAPSPTSRMKRDTGEVEATDHSNMSDSHMFFFGSVSGDLSTQRMLIDSESSYQDNMSGSITEAARRNGENARRDATVNWTSELLPTPSYLQSHSSPSKNGTNILGFSIRDVTITPQKKSSISYLSYVLYILLSVFIVIALIIGVLLLVWRHYKSRRKTDDIVVVKSMKNEREESRRRDRESWGDKPAGPHTTLNSESNLQMVKVKTLAVTVRNNLEEEGTEV
ncbi:VWFC domain [Trinorchestia longiramus]|nr:VWFC domain [Trinorchestia longiramus]